MAENLKVALFLLIACVVIPVVTNLLIDRLRWRRSRKTGERQAVDVLRRCDEYMREHE